MAINIMRTKLGAPRKEKELFETFDCDDIAAQALVRALRAADVEYWYWHEDESKYEGPEYRKNFYDPQSRTNGDEVLETAS